MDGKCATGDGISNIAMQSLCARHEVSHGTVPIFNSFALLRN